MPYHLTYDQLLLDLHHAYIDARRNKRQKSYQQRFEACAAEHLTHLCDELWNRVYQPDPSSCFIITDPKLREVFAAQFCERIVHHLYYNYTHEMLERNFIADSYSCIKRRGTHYGIKRLEGHIRQESQNYTETCHVLKMDIKGYFMHINRSRLLKITLTQLRKMASHKVSKTIDKKWEEVVDMDFIEYLTQTIIMQNPVENCRRHGSAKDWYRLPPEKSLFFSDEGCGLPIGNLTSQLFSNVYLNELDQYAKRQLGCKHYGRYVDDFYVVSADIDWLHEIQRAFALFLHLHLCLEVNGSKTMICDARKGVQFLGAFLKPHRRYVAGGSLRRMKKKVTRLNKCDSPSMLRSTINSYLGLLSHYSSYRIRRDMFFNMPFVHRYGHYLSGMRKYVLRTMI